MTCAIGATVADEGRALRPYGTDGDAPIHAPTSGFSMKIENHDYATLAEGSGRGASGGRPARPT